MKFGIAFANAGPFANPELLAHLAVEAERVGIESLWTVEHVVIPVGYTSEYPYDRTGKMPGPQDIAIPDPLLSLAYAAALTRTIRLATGVLILPQRHPLYIAKEAATLDVLSRGRAILGIGIGWLKEEFDALNIPFEERAGRTHETVRAMRDLWKEGPSTFEGKYFRWSSVESAPKPVQPGGVPIVLGGHTDMAAKRAARYGNGFFPAGRFEETRIVELLGILLDECARVGRNPADIEITLPMPGRKLDRITRLAELGAARLTMGAPGFDKQGITDGLNRFVDEIASKL